MSGSTRQPKQYHPQPGDIFACWGTDLVSRGISIETSLTSWLFGPKGLRLSPSHVAIACRLPNSGRCYWYESTTMTPRRCLLAERPVTGVQVHEISDRLRDYCINAQGAVAVYRLADIHTLEAGEAVRLQAILQNLCGTPDRPAKRYDLAGAMISGTRVLKYSPFSRANLDSLFCSELIAALLQRLCRMNHEDPSRYNPGYLLRQLVRQGTYRYETLFERRSE